MTECNGCGQCCMVIELPITRLEAIGGDVGLDQRTTRWVTEELVPLTLDQARDRAPWIDFAATRQAWHPNGHMTTVRYYYRCLNHDEETGLCTAHADRPETCRSFPTGTPGWPDPRINLPPACAYRADVGQPITPVTLGRR